MHLDSSTEGVVAYEDTSECSVNGKSPSPSPSFQQINSRKGLRRILPQLGPAFVAAIAYVDPGNFATNIAGGAKFGYLLVWVVVVANLIGMFVQNMSAKLGLVTGQNLPQQCRKHLPRPASYMLWLLAELVAMATDLAEFIGASIALNLLFGVPLFVGGLMTGVISFAILALQQRGYRWFELTIGGMLGLILLGFLYDALQISQDWGAVSRGFVPSFKGSESVLLACGILGATVMPHVIYLHSALTQDRISTANLEERRRVHRFLKIDVFIAMTIAGVVNLLMLIIAASLFHKSGITNVESLKGAHAGFEQLLGGGAAFAFAGALLASGLASSSVGTYAGQVIMQGFIARSIPLVVRRLVTMAPALIVLAIGLDPSRSLIISQVVLSFGIPFALIPLVWLTSKQSVMGSFANQLGTKVVGVILASAIVSLNVFLLYVTFAKGV
ncbi:MAG: Nramp family divalent metal transporter [Patescibacteria group bacterium]|nr:Nramp family divalent metal transporter [Patescibacteria group bacterium]